MISNIATASLQVVYIVFLKLFLKLYRPGFLTGPIVGGGGGGGGGGGWQQASS